MRTGLYIFVIARQYRDSEINGKLGIQIFSLFEISLLFTSNFN